MHHHMRRTTAVLLACLCAFALFVYARGQGSGTLQQSVANAEQLAAALKVYVADWDERFPPMKTQPAFQKALKGYAPASVFICPLTNQPFQPNAVLSGRPATFVKDSGSLPAVSAAIPGEATLVAYLDGHVQQGKVDLTDPTAESVQNARRVTTGLLQYTQDYDEHFPIVTTPSQLQQVLAPYVRDQHSFLCPLSGKSFRLNPQLSGLAVSAILDFDTMPAIWDYPAQPNNQSVIAYFDLLVERGGIDLINPIQEGDERIGRLIAGLNEYTQDYDETLPPTRNAAVFKQAVYPYVGSDRGFISPFSQQPYTPNPALNGKTMAMIKDLSSVFGVKDPVPAADGKTMIGYLDGYITRGGVDQGDPLVETSSNARQLTLSLVMYAQDYDEVLPLGTSQAQFKSALSPYVRASRVYTCPYTHTVFTFNAALSGQSLVNIANPGKTMTVQDPKPERGGRRTTGYLDGHVSPSRASPWP